MNGPDAHPGGFRGLLSEADRGRFEPPGHGDAEGERQNAGAGEWGRAAPGRFEPRRHEGTKGEPGRDRARERGRDAPGECEPPRHQDTKGERQKHGDRERGRDAPGGFEPRRHQGTKGERRNEAAREWGRDAPGVPCVRGLRFDVECSMFAPRANQDRGAPSNNPPGTRRQGGRGRGAGAGPVAARTSTHRSPNERPAHFSNRRRSAAARCGSDSQLENVTVHVVAIARAPVRSPKGPPRILLRDRPPMDERPCAGRQGGHPVEAAPLSPPLPSLNPFAPVRPESLTAGAIIAGSGAFHALHRAREGQHPQRMGVPPLQPLPKQNVPAGFAPRIPPPPASCSSHSSLSGGRRGQGGTVGEGAHGTPGVAP
jgi:hypothetical protein